MSAVPTNQRSQPTEPTGQGTTLWLLQVAKVVVVFIYAFVLINLTLLALGLFLRLFGASTDAEFTRWVYRNVDRIMEPFRGMFPSHAVTDQSVLDVSLLFAMIVYAVVGIALHALVGWLTEKVVAARRGQQLTVVQGPQPDGPAVPPPGPPGVGSYTGSDYPRGVPASSGLADR